MLKEMCVSEAFIVAAARTAGGRRGGRLSSIHPADLAACVLDHLVTLTGAEMLAAKYDLSKDELDQFAFESHRKAIVATQAGEFAEQIVPPEKG
jgi:acetyl-CoA acetyltransferase